MQMIIVSIGAILAGSLLTALAVWRTWRFVRRGEKSLHPFPGRPQERAIRRDASPPAASSPRVSILKPVCGLDDGLEGNLRSFLALRDVPYEVIVSIADRDDPAIPVVRRVAAQAPEGTFRVVIGGGGPAKNRKVARLIAARRAANGEILLVSDSNVRVEPDSLARTLRAFDDASIGCVSNLFTAAGARTFGARIESLHLLTFVVTGNVLAAWVGATCVVGKSMALRRDVLDAIGGFEAFRDVLAEDQAIGLAVKRAGWRVSLSPTIVRNVSTHRTVRAAVARQVRWNKIRYAFSPFLYSAEFVLNPAPLTAVAAVSATALDLMTARQAVAAYLVMSLLRVIEVVALGVAARVPLSTLDVLAVPVQDLLQFGAQFAPYFSREIEWRGHRARLGPGTVILEDEAAPVAA